MNFNLPSIVSTVITKVSLLAFTIVLILAAFIMGECIDQWFDYIDATDMYQTLNTAAKLAWYGGVSALAIMAAYIFSFVIKLPDSQAAG